MDPQKKLATAIILQALKDARNGNQDALQWILEAGPGFSYWCRVYGMDPGRARDCLKKAIEAAWIHAIEPACIVGYEGG